MNPVLLRTPACVRLALAVIALGSGLTPLLVRAADGSAPGAAAAAGPRLTLAESMHDFGTVTQGSVLAHEFTITNTGNAVLEISEITPSCGCTTADEWPHTLKPGESGVIPIKVDTERFVGAITKTVSITSNDSSRPTAILLLKATIWTPVSIQNPVLVFPAVTDPTQSGTRATTIRNETGAAMKLTEPQSTSRAFKPSLKPVIAGKEYELTVSTVPPLGDGTQVGRITMKSSLPDMPEIAVQAVVTVLPAVQVAPAQIMLPAARLAGPEKRFAVILNHRGYDLALSDVSTNAPGAEIATTKSADGKQFTIAVTFPAGFTIADGQTLYLRGRTNHPGVPAFEIPIVATPRD